MSTVTSSTRDAATPAGYVPAMAVINLPEDRDEACEMLASRDQFAALRDGSLTAELQVPPGVWRYWPVRRVAFWFGRRTDAYPPVRANAGLDLYELILRLANHGYLLRDLKALRGDRWSTRLRAGAALRTLAADPAVAAVRGVWADPLGRAVRLEIHNCGAMTAEDGVKLWDLAEAVGAVLNE